MVVVDELVFWTACTVGAIRDNCATRASVKTDSASEAFLIFISFGLLNPSGRELCEAKPQFNATVPMAETKGASNFSARLINGCG